MNPPPPNQESKLEEMLDRILESQQKLQVDFNGKIDSVYTNLNKKLDSLSTYVKKLETHVVQTGVGVEIGQDKIGVRKSRKNKSTI